MPQCQPLTVGIDYNLLIAPTNILGGRLHKPQGATLGNERTGARGGGLCSNKRMRWPLDLARDGMSLACLNNSEGAGT